MTRESISSRLPGRRTQPRALPKRMGTVLAAALLATTGALAVTESAAAALFSPSTAYDVGATPTAVLSADFNADGSPDLATANFDNADVSVLAGLGNGRFGERADFAVGADPSAMTSEDFDRDGSPDIATTDWYENTVSVLLGTGAGGFGPRTTSATGLHAWSLDSADFNGDGNLDLATADWGDSTVSVLLGDGTGSFAAKAGFATGARPTAVTSADFDGDGHADLAVANASDAFVGGQPTVSVLLGDGRGGFGAKADFPAGAGPTDLTSADLNGDGHPDLAIANGSANTVSVLLGDGGGGFGAKADFEVGSGPHSVAAADFDSDGNLDLVSADMRSNTVSVLFGTGSGSFGARKSFGVGTGPHSVTAADLDGDGRPDLASADGSSDTVSVRLNAIGPAARITSGPGEELRTSGKRAKVTVRFTSSEHGATFSCKLDKADYRRCASPYSAWVKSKPGRGKRHEISVKAHDEAGESGRPATVEFTVIRKGRSG